jgi:hypothetical protein
MPELGPDAILAWFDSRFPDPKRDAELLRVFSAPGAESVEMALDAFGAAMWAVLSDNNYVFDAQGNDVNLGSFRSSSDEIAEWLNRCAGEHWFHDMDFYCAGPGNGGGDARRREWILQQFRFIFGRLHRAGDRWQVPDYRLRDPGAVSPIMEAYRDVYGAMPEATPPIS